MSDPIDKLMGLPPRQGFGQETLPDGTVIRFFQDYFGPDLDVYICRRMEELWYEDQYENPEETERLLQSMTDGDLNENWQTKSIHLEDVSTDGRVYFNGQEQFEDFGDIEMFLENEEEEECFLDNEFRGW